MELIYRAPEGQEDYRLNPSELLAEIKAVLGGWSDWHSKITSNVAVITLGTTQESKAALVNAVVATHISNTETREYNQAIDCQMRALENNESRKLRELWLMVVAPTLPSDDKERIRVQVVNDQVAVLRAQRQ